MYNHYLNAMKEYLERNRPSYGEEDIHTLIDFLFCKFVEENPLVNDNIREGFHKLGKATETMPNEMKDDLFYLVSDLCLDHSRKSFRDGFLVGVRLVMEMKCI